MQFDETGCSYDDGNPDSPNYDPERYGYLCKHCRNVVVKDTKGTLVDETGGDVCGWDGGNEPHEVEAEDLPRVTVTDDARSSLVRSTPATTPPTTLSKQESKPTGGSARSPSSSATRMETGCSDMAESVVVPQLPECDVHRVVKQIPRVVAHYDGKTKLGPWANMCQECFDEWGIGLGTGRGQQLILKEGN